MVNTKVSQNISYVYKHFEQGRVTKSAIKTKRTESLA